MSATNDADAADSSTDALSTEEVLRRFPEVELINDDDVREETLRVLAEHTPDYFWETAATQSSDFHNPRCRGKHGLWVHTKMNFTAYEGLVDSWVELDYITDKEADYGRAAILLHDLFKKGTNDEPDQKAARNDHDIIIGEFIRDETSLPEEVALAVSEHMGGWYDGPSPTRKLSLLVHQADMMGSRPNVHAEVLNPAEELTDNDPELLATDSL